MNLSVPKFKEYKIESISEGFLGTILFHASSLPVKKIEERINLRAKEGWQVVFQVLEEKRLLLFWQRETILITFGR